MNRHLNESSVGKVERKQPIQLELFSQNISSNLYSNLSESGYNNGNLQKRYKKPTDIEPVDCDVW